MRLLAGYHVLRYGHHQQGRWPPYVGRAREKLRLKFYVYWWHLHRRRHRGENSTQMQDRLFLQAFLDKGRMSPLLEDMPVKIVLNDDSGLIGAARYALIQKAFGKVSRS